MRKSGLLLDHYTEGAQPQTNKKYLKVQELLFFLKNAVFGLKMAKYEIWTLSLVIEKSVFQRNVSQDKTQSTDFYCSLQKKKYACWVFSPKKLTTNAMGMVLWSSKDFIKISNVERQGT